MHFSSQVANDELASHLRESLRGLDDFALKSEKDRFDAYWKSKRASDLSLLTFDEFEDLDKQVLEREMTRRVVMGR